MSKYLVKKIDLDLTTAKTKQIENVAGNRLQVITVSDLSADISVSVSGKDRQSSGDFSLKIGDYVEFPKEFDEISLTWAAQSGVTITLIVVDQDPAPVSFNYHTNSRGLVEGISSSVSTTSGGSFTHGAVTVTTSATEIVPADSNRTRLTMIPDVDVYIGGAGVLTNDGLPLLAGQPYTVDTSGAVYAVVASGTADVRYNAEGA